MTLPFLSVRSALSKNPPALDFVLPGLVAGTAGIVVGAGAIGKTMLLTQMAMALSADVPAADIFEIPNKPCRVVLVAAEESADILGIRLHAINDWVRRRTAQTSLISPVEQETRMELLDKNLRIYPGAGHSVQLVKDGVKTAFFDSLCTACKGARLIIIDPLRRLHDGDENSSAAMTHIVQTLEALATETGAAVIATHHMSKIGQFSGANDSASASRGSSALTDAVRWQLNMSGMSETEAKALGVTDSRKLYVRLDFSKANYIAQQEAIWLKRLAGGVLARADFDDAEEKTTRRQSSRSTRSAAGGINV